MPDYYTLLQISSNASLKQIRTSYRRLAKTCHPDLHPGDPQLQARFIQLTQAYDMLADETTRRRYDEEREKRREPEPPKPERSTQYYTPRPQEDFLKDIIATYKASQRKQVHIDWLHAVFYSPITYCLIVLVLLLAAYMQVIENVKHAVSDDRYTHRPK